MSASYKQTSFEIGSMEQSINTMPVANRFSNIQKFEPKPKETFRQVQMSSINPQPVDPSNISKATKTNPQRIDMAQQNLHAYGLYGKSGNSIEHTDIENIEFEITGSGPKIMEDYLDMKLNSSMLSAGLMSAMQIMFLTAEPAYAKGGEYGALECVPEALIHPAIMAGILGASFYAAF